MTCLKSRRFRSMCTEASAATVLLAASYLRSKNRGEYSRARDYRARHSGLRGDDEQKARVGATPKASLNNKLSSGAARDDARTKHGCSRLNQSASQAHSVVARLERFGERYRSRRPQWLFLQVISKGFMRLVGAAAITHLFACVRSSRPSTKLLQSTGRHTDVTAAWRYLTSPFIPWSAFKC